jgi:arylsulfatase
VPLFAKDGTVAHESLWWLHEENRALRVGNWKIVAAGKESSWELYDLANDRAESRNLAAKRPDKVRELTAQWTRETTAYNALALTNPPSEAPIEDRNHR